MKIKSLLFSFMLGGAAIASSQAIAGGSIGGNCCSDLEERVAELEATTARKGNRRVTLQVSGNVHYALLFSDAPEARDVEIFQTAATQSKFRFVGKAKISSDYYAGYRMEFGLGRTSFGAFDRGENGTVGLGLLTEGPIEIRYNEVFVGSKTLGKISLGFGETASDFAAQVDLSGTIFFGGGNLDEYHVVSDLDGFTRRQRIRYDTPTLAGFRFSASWQDNESWDVALRYGSAWGDFTVAGAVAYFENGDGAQSAYCLAIDAPLAGGQCGNGAGQLRTDVGGKGAVVGSGSILHRPTGISLTVAGADADFDILGIQNYWYVKGGIQRKIFSVGTSAFSVDYKEINDGDVEKFGIQFVQNIDAAGMKFFASFWDAESDSTLLTLPDETAGMIGLTVNF